MTLRQKRALAALLNSPTRAKAAEEAGVGVSTLREWLRTDEEFKAKYQRATAELLEDAALRSKRSLAKALNTLDEVMDAGENGQVRVAAARASLEYSLRLHEIADVNRRVAAVEEKVKENNDYA